MGTIVGKHIILGITGSIAAYKAADIVSGLIKRGARVTPVMTAEACRFITPAALSAVARTPALCDLWAEHSESRPSHIDLAMKADLLLIAPATAHIMACMAHGLAPDLLTCTYLAMQKPVLLAPAMNSAMYAHPATQTNLECLRKRGHIIIEPATGMLACGTTGKGRLADLDDIFAAVEKQFS